MTTPATQFTLAELCIVAAAEAFRGDGEVLATGIGVIPRLAASLAMKTFEPDLMMTDSEAWLLSEPNPLGRRGDDFQPATETWMGFSRIFDNVWSGRRHAMLGPTQIDRFGQSNTSALGGSYQQPKVMMLGARGFPGQLHLPPEQLFCTLAQYPGVRGGGVRFRVLHRLQPGAPAPGARAGRYRDSPHHYGPVRDGLRRPRAPGAAAVPAPGGQCGAGQENTGFPVQVPASVPETAAPTEEQLAIIAALDPHNQRAHQIKG